MTKTKTTAVKSNGVTITKIKEGKPKKKAAKQTLQDVHNDVSEARHFLDGVINQAIPAIKAHLADTDKDLQACHEAHCENEMEIRKSIMDGAKKTASSVKLITLAQILQAIALLLVIFKVGA